MSGPKSSLISTQHLNDCQKPANEASCLPAGFYTSSDVAAAEIDKVFRQKWIGVGRSDLVTSPGDYIALDIAGQNLILLRDKDHRLRAFANTCRHRGARLVDGDGSCRGLRCPFHSWFYGLDGRLVSAPQMDGVDGFDKADYGLVRYHAQERNGFAFVCLSSSPPDIDDHLDDFSGLHADWPLDTLVTVRRRTLEVACNWKLFLEVFNEYYHLPFVHPNSINSIYSAPEAADVVNGAFASQFGTTEGTGGLLESDQDQALPDMPGLAGNATKGARYTWVFPNMTFAASRDALWCYEAYPLGPDVCKVVQSVCFPAETMALSDFEQRSLSYLGRTDAALNEDIPALVNQHKGMQCSDAKPGRFQPQLEANVASFARWYSGLWSS